MVRKTKQEALVTKEKILDAAEHVFYRNGVSLTGLEDIAREAGMTRGAIYWHFKNKADVFYAMHARVHFPLEELITRITQDPSHQALHQLRQVCIDAILDLERDEQKKRIFSVLMFKCDYSGDMEEGMADMKAIQNRMMDQMTKFFEGCQKKGLIAASSASPRILSQSLCSFMNGLFRNYLINPSSYGPQKAIEEMIVHFFRTTIGVNAV